MTSPERSSLLELYQRKVCFGALQYLEKQTGRKSRRGVYGAAVVLWLMMLQRLAGARNAGQRGPVAAGRSGRASAGALPAGAPETDFVPDRRLLPSTA